MLVQFVGLSMLASIPNTIVYPPTPCKILTRKLRLRGHFRQQFRKVGEVVGEELGVQDDVLPRPRRGEGTSQQFHLPSNPQS